jgi:hypothetical protein
MTQSAVKRKTKQGKNEVKERKKVIFVSCSRIFSIIQWHWSFERMFFLGQIWSIFLPLNHTENKFDKTRLFLMTEDNRCNLICGILLQSDRFYLLYISFLSIVRSIYIHNLICSPGKARGKERYVNRRFSMVRMEEGRVIVTDRYCIEPEAHPYIFLLI